MSTELISIRTLRYLYFIDEQNDEAQRSNLSNAV